MGEGKVKTAFELAMEKVAEMPKLNTDELQEERKKESIAKGEAIAQKYLQHIHRKSDIQGEIAALNEDQQGVAKKAALSCLSREFSLTQPELNRHILEGMSQLKNTIAVDPSQSQIDGIINGFIKELQEVRLIVENIEIANLVKEGISGSAVTPNLKTSKVWQEKHAQLSAAYTGKLYEFQRNLLSEQL